MLARDWASSDLRWDVISVRGPGSSEHAQLNWRPSKPRERSMMQGRTVNTITSDPIEMQVAEAATKYHHDQQGWAPKTLRAHIVSDMVIIYSSGIYTPTEESLSDTEEGRKLIKSARRELRSITRKDIESRLASILGCEVLRSFWDLDIRSGEQVEVYMLSRSADFPSSSVTVV